PGGGSAPRPRAWRPAGTRAPRDPPPPARRRCGTGVSGSNVALDRRRGRDAAHGGGLAWARRGAAAPLGELPLDEGGDLRDGVEVVGVDLAVAHGDAEALLQE